MKKISTTMLARAGVIAGIYIVISLITFPIASGAVQLRLSEGLCILPLIYIEAVPALFIGCLLSNVITGCAILDVFLGSVVTLVSAVLTFFAGKIIKQVALKILLGGIFPVMLNALTLPIIWVWCYGAPEYIYFIQAGILLIGQAVSVYAVGTPLYLSIKKLNNFTKKTKT